MERMSDEELKQKYDSIQAEFDSALPYELEVEHIAERQRFDWLNIGYKRLEKENAELKDQVIGLRRENEQIRAVLTSREDIKRLDPRNEEGFNCSGTRDRLDQAIVNELFDKCR